MSNAITLEIMGEENGICCSGVEGALVNTQVVVFYHKHNTVSWDQSFAKHNTASKCHFAKTQLKWQTHGTCLAKFGSPQTKKTRNNCRHHKLVDLWVDSRGNELWLRLDKINCHFPGPWPKREQTLLCQQTNTKLKVSICF